jgi:hypothetical protein
MKPAISVAGLTRRYRGQFVLDEPYAGLDAVARQLFYDRLRADYAEHPRTVLLSIYLIDAAGRGPRCRQARNRRARKDKRMNTWINVARYHLVDYHLVDRINYVALPWCSLLTCIAAQVTVLLAGGDATMRRITV